MPLEQPDGVAVVIAVKNDAGTIRRAVASALAQPETCQVIVIDDGSTDATAANAQAADDRSGRLVVRTLERSVGPAAARNLALEMVRAAWITPLDGDDFLQPGRFGRMLAQAEGADLLADDMLLVTEGEEDATPRRLVGDRLVLPAEIGFAQFMDWNISRPGMDRRELGFLKPLIRVATINRLGLRYDGALRLGEDVVLYATALARGARLRLLAPCGYVAVQRKGSLSGRHSLDDLKALMRALEKLGREGGLAGAEAAAAARHRRHVRQKVALREVLEAKREHGLAGAAVMALKRLPSATYVVRQIVSDKLRDRAGAREAAKAADPVRA